MSSTNIGTLGKYEQKASVKINLHCLSLLSFIQKITNFQPIIEVKQLKVGGKSHCEINAFTIHVGHNYWHPIIAKVLFPAQQLWVFSYNAWRVWRNTWQEIRDHFFIQNLSRSFRFHSSMTVLLLFSSPHSFSVGFRSEDRDSNG